MSEDVVTAEQSESLRTEVADLVNHVDETYYELGGKLSAIARQDIYSAWDSPDGGKFKTFEEYVEKELGFAKRKAYYLIQIHDKATELGITEAQLSTVGWTKGREILRYVENDGDFIVWADRARTMTVSKLQEMLKLDFEGKVTPKKGTDDEGNKTIENEDGEVFHILEVPLAEAQYENVKPALERAKEIAGSDKLGHIIDMICLDFLSHNASLTDLGGKLADWVNRGLIEFEEDEPASEEAEE